MDQEMFRSGAGTWYDDTQKDETSTRSWWPWALIGGSAGLALAFAAGFLGGHQDVPTLQHDKGVLQRQLDAERQHEQVLLAGKRCFTYTPQILEVQRLLQAGKSGVAAALIPLYLHDIAHPACTQTRAELGALGYRSAMDGLFVRTDTNPVDHSPLLTWLSAERQADDIGVPLDQRVSPLSVAHEAYNAHMWELARAAFLRAWQESLVGPGDVNQIAWYYAALRNEGKALIAWKVPETRKQGFMLLRSADEISQAYSLGRGEAHQDLIDVLGAHTPNWPTPDGHDPVLHAGHAG